MFFNRGRAYNPDEVPGPEAVLRTDDHWSTHGLVGYWPMLEGRGGVVRDYARGNHGLATNMVAWQELHGGWSVDPTDGIEFANLGIFDGSKPFTFVGSFSISQFPASTMFDDAHTLVQTTGEAALFLMLGDSTPVDRLSVRVEQAGNWKNGPVSQALSLNQPYAYAISYRPTAGWTMWIDGVLHGEVTLRGPIGARSNVNAYGWFYAVSPRRWQGTIGPQGIYDRALSAAEITELHAHPYLPLWRPASVSVWDMGAVGRPRPYTQHRHGPRLVIGGLS